MQIATFYRSSWPTQVKNDIAARNISLVPKVSPLPAPRAVLAQAMSHWQSGEWAQGIELLQVDRERFIGLHGEDFYRATVQANAVHCAEFGFYDDAVKRLDSLIAKSSAKQVARHLGLVSEMRRVS